MTSLVQLIQIIEAIKRKPEYYKDITFFSDWDLWQYHHSNDGKVCDECLGLENLAQVIGSKIRLLFPNLEIAGVLRVDVFVHPNCRCWLTRLTPIERYYARGEEPTPDIQFDVTVQPEVKNPKRSRRVLIKMASVLPSAHTEDIMKGFRVVKESPYHNYGEYDGVEIRIRADVLEEEHARHIVYHEVGHHVWYDDLTYDDRDKWRRIWRRAPMPTQYAKYAPRNQVEEGFAECYSIYYNEFSKFKLNIEVKRFIEEVKDRRG